MIKPNILEKKIKDFDLTISLQLSPDRNKLAIIAKKDQKEFGAFYDDELMPQQLTLFRKCEKIFREMGKSTNMTVNQVRSNYVILTITFSIFEEEVEVPFNLFLLPKRQVNFDNFERVRIPLESAEHRLNFDQLQDAINQSRDTEREDLVLQKTNEEHERNLHSIQHRIQQNKAVIAQNQIKLSQERREQIINESNFLKRENDCLIIRSEGISLQVQKIQKERIRNQNKLLKLSEIILKILEGLLIIGVTGGMVAGGVGMCMMGMSATTTLATAGFLVGGIVLVAGGLHLAYKAITSCD